MRASEISILQPSFPKMDLSALYCLGITIQEYVRHLSTDLLAQKRAAENKPPINNFYTPQEIQARTLEAVIQKYKPQTSTIAHAQHASTITARPNIDQELHRSAKQAQHRVEIKTSEKATRYDKILADPKWTGTLVKNRDLKANSEQAAVRRAKAEAAQKMRLEAQQALKEKEEQQQEERELLMPRKRVRSENDDTNYDMFDKANHSKPKKAKASSSNKKKTAASSQKGF